MASTLSILFMLECCLGRARRLDIQTRSATIGREILLEWLVMRRTLLIAVLFLSLLGLSTGIGRADPPADPPAPVAGSPADSWLVFRGDAASTGVSRTDCSGSLDLLWKYQVEGSGFESTAAIARGVVYLADLDGGLHALHLADGKLKWQQESASDIGFVASPVSKDGYIFVGDLDGVFRCFDASTGETTWEFQTQSEMDSAASFDQDRVLFGSQDATLYCLQSQSGELCWKFQIDDQIRCTPSISDGMAFVVGCDAKLHVIDIQSGKSAGSVEIDGPSGVTPAIIESHAYFGTESGKFYAIDWRQQLVDWEFSDFEGGGAFRSSAAANRSLIVVGSRNKRVYGIQTATGKQTWEFVTKRNVDSSPVIAGDRVFFGSDEGRIYALQLESGKKLWEYETGGHLKASPAIASGRIVIANTDGAVYCFGSASP